MNTNHKPILFSVGFMKLLVLGSLIPLYEILWMYRNWEYLKNKRALKVSPAVRSLFAPFFVWSLFHEMTAVILEEGGKAPLFKPKILAVFYIAITLLSLCDRPVGFIASFLFVVPLLILQRRVNELNGGEAHIENRKLTLINWLALIFGVVVWAAMEYCSWKGYLR